MEYRTYGAQSSSKTAAHEMFGTIKYSQEAKNFLTALQKFHEAKIDSDRKTMERNKHFKNVQTYVDKIRQQQPNFLPSGLPCPYYVEKYIFPYNRIQLWCMNNVFFFLATPRPGVSYVIFREKDLEDLLDLYDPTYQNNASGQCPFYYFKPTTDEFRSMFYLARQRPTFKLDKAKLSPPSKISYLSMLMRYSAFILAREIMQHALTANGIIGTNQLAAKTLRGLELVIPIHCNASALVEDHLFKSLRDVPTNNKCRNIINCLRILSCCNTVAVSNLLILIGKVLLGHQFNKLVNSPNRLTIIRCKHKGNIKMLIERIFAYEPPPAHQVTPFLDPSLTGNQNRQFFDSSPATIHPIEFSNYHRDEDLLEILYSEICGIHTFCTYDDSTTFKKSPAYKLLSPSPVPIMNDPLMGSINYGSDSQYIWIMDEHNADALPSSNISYDLIDLPCEEDLSDEIEQISNNEQLMLLATAAYSAMEMALGGNTKIASIKPQKPCALNTNEAVQQFLEKFFTDTTDTIEPDQIEVAVKESGYGYDELVKSSNDSKRKELAKALGITDLPYTLMDDIVRAYEQWQKSSPTVIPSDVNLKEYLIDKYNPLFYLKWDNPTNMYNPNAKKTSGKVFLGLQLDKEKLDKETANEVAPVIDNKETFDQYCRDLLSYFRSRNELLEKYFPAS